MSESESKTENQPFSSLEQIGNFLHRKETIFLGVLAKASINAHSAAGWEMISYANPKQITKKLLLTMLPDISCLAKEPDSH